MVEVIRAGLSDKIADIGPLHFLWAEWWNEAPQFVLLKYSLHGREERLGIRLDLDKKAILDSVGDTSLDSVLHSKSGDIWNVVVQEKMKVAHPYEG